MKIRSLYISLLLCASGMFTSCMDLLNTPQLGVTSVDDFYKTDTDVEEAAVAMYGALSDSYMDIFMIKNLLSDDVWCGGGSRGDNANYEIINEYRFTADAVQLTSYYKNLYKIIYRANLILNKVQPDSDVKTRCIAEAHFFRAFAYFDLVTLWGPVPLITEAERDDYKASNSTVDALWGLIEDDLLAAINPKVLPEKTSVNDNTTGIRVTHQLAQAFLGKVYVFRERYSEAMSLLDEVVESGKYTLFKDADYGDIYLAGNNNNCESMFEINKVNDPAVYTYGAVPMMLGWRPEKFSNIYELVSQGLLDIYTNGFGYLNPTKKLYEAFVDEEGEDGYRLNQTIKRYEDLNKNIGLTLLEGQYYYGSEGFFVWKNRTSPQNYVAGTWAGFWNNDRLMRYAEVLLLAAEAHIMGGGTKGDYYLNLIRERAHLSPIENATLDDVKKEKRLELCMECVRYQDLLRWGDAEELLKDQGKKIPALYGYNEDGSLNVTFTWTNTNAGFVAGKHELLPIPQEEMNINPNMEQNPNY